MCEGKSSPRRAGVLRLAVQPGVPLGDRLRGIAVNLLRRGRAGRLHDCCGHYGEPGC